MLYRGRYRLEYGPAPWWKDWWRRAWRCRTASPSPRPDMPGRRRVPAEAGQLGRRPRFWEWEPMAIPWRPKLLALKLVTTTPASQLYQAPWQAWNNRGLRVAFARAARIWGIETAV